MTVVFFFNSGASTPRTKAVGGEFGSPRGDRQACDTPSPIASLLPTKMRGGAGGRANGANGGAGEGEAGPRGGQILFGSPGILLGKIYLCIHANTRARTHTHTHTRERERSREGGGVELGGGVRKVVGCRRRTCHKA